MKTKRLNRGLVLGGALLVGLAGFVMFDYFNFKSNKSDIQAAVEAYLNDSARANLADSGSIKEEWKKVLDDNWGYNEFYEKNFVFDYVTATDIKDSITNTPDSDLKMGSLSECSVKMGEVKVSKAGPNLAQATVNYTVDFKGKGQAHLITLNGVSNAIYNSMNFQTAELDWDDESTVFDDLEYKGRLSYEDNATFYLEYEGGKWKIVAAEGYTDDFFITDEEGSNIDLDKAAKHGGSSEQAPDDEKIEPPAPDDSGKVQIKLPDGTVMDLPEGAEIIGGDLADIDLGKVEKMPEAGSAADDTSMPEPTIENPIADSSEQQEEGGADNG